MQFGLTNITRIFQFCIKEYGRYALTALSLTNAVTATRHRADALANAINDTALAVSTTGMALANEVSTCLLTSAVFTAARRHEGLSHLGAITQHKKANIRQNIYIDESVVLVRNFAATLFLCKACVVSIIYESILTEAAFCATV